MNGLNVCWKKCIRKVEPRSLSKLVFPCDDWWVLACIQRLGMWCSCDLPACLSPCEWLLLVSCAAHLLEFYWSVWWVFFCGYILGHWIVYCTREVVVMCLYFFVRHNLPFICCSATYGHWWLFVACQFYVFVSTNLDYINQMAHFWLE